MHTRTRRTSLSLLSFALALSLAPLAHATDAQAPDGPRARPDALSLIPAPAHVERLDGAPFKVEASTPVWARGDAATRVARQFSTLLHNSGGPTLQVKNGTARTASTSCSTPR